MSASHDKSPADDSLAPFREEAAAYRFVERCVWPAGPVCPHCHGSSRVRPLHGSSTRVGAYKCYACRKPFTVKVGTILESSNLPMHKWLQAILLTVARGCEAVSVSELSHMLNVAPRTASYVLQRLCGPGAVPLHVHLADLAANRNSAAGAVNGQFRHAG